MILKATVKKYKNRCYSKIPNLLSLKFFVDSLLPYKIGGKKKLGWKKFWGKKKGKKIGGEKKVGGEKKLGVKTICC